MPGPLDGQVAAVTGASSGIGEATARHLAAAGASVVVGARRRDRLDSLVQQIEGDGGRALAVEVDVADEEACNRFVSAANDQLGGLDVLVNNAGVMLLGSVEGADTGEWRRMVEANVFGVLYCTHAALPIMRDTGGGHIVNVSSTAGRTARAGNAVYNMTKWGVTGFSEALRQEALEIGVRVTALEPGYVETELRDHMSDERGRDAQAKLREQIDPLTSDDCAEVITFIVSRPAHVGINEVLLRPSRQLP